MKQFAFACLVIFGVPLFFAAVLTGCPQNPQPVPPSPPDATDAQAVGEAMPEPTPPPVDASDPAVRACVSLLNRGCALGRAPNCIATMQLPARFGINAQCVIDAGRAGSLQPCGVACTN
jgi:hypothetical protein